MWDRTLLFRVLFYSFLLHEDWSVCIQDHITQYAMSVHIFAITTPYYKVKQLEVKEYIAETAYPQKKPQTRYNF